MRLDVHGEVIEIEDLKRVAFGPDDLLVIRVSERFTPNQVREYTETLQAFLFPDDPRPRVLIVMGEMVGVRWWG
jgi:hypothetical protein